MTRKTRATAGCLRSMLMAWAAIAAPVEICAKERPRLVLQITVDQLRGDMAERLIGDRFVEGGFKHLYEQGVVYRDAHHGHANTETIVGHVTLATGADPAIHGMVGNVWFDRETGELGYAVEDARHPLLTAGAGVAETEIDPTQKAARSDGRSPANMLVSTFGDELSIATQGEAKVFGVSVKDRGAISMAGHAGKAFWFDKATGGFVTSSYYYDALPTWVVEWNDAGHVAAYGDTEWHLSADQGSYSYGARDDRPFEFDFAGFGRVFPHPFGPADGRFFTTLLTFSPAGDELTANFAKLLIDKEGLGKDNVPDYLAVSFSSTDYVGHVFGPASLESEANMLRLDRTLADLFAHVDEAVGLDRTLIVLSADHGAAEAPAYLEEYGLPTRYLNPGDWDTAAGIVRLKERFGIGKALITGFSHPYLFLNNDAIRAAGLNLAEVEQAVAEELLAFDGVAFAVPSSALASGSLADTPLNRSVLRNYNPKRSGNLYVVYEPGSMINDFNGLTVAATHGSPWRYDTFVPIIFAEPGLRSGEVFRSVETVDVAPTLSAILGVKRPSGSWGNVLPEVLAPLR